MYKIVFDTETTGLDPKEGHKLIEVAGIKMDRYGNTISTLHLYIDPKRDIDEGAQRVHGISREQLKGEPEFKEVASKIVDFFKGATVIAHNAPFDVKFMNAELEAAGYPSFEDITSEVIDTLKWAKDLHPGHKNTLDALCDRYEIDRSHRDLHGALIDTQILGLLYLEMEKARTLDKVAKMLDIEDRSIFEFIVPERTGKILMATPEEINVHSATMKKIFPKGNIWETLESQPGM